MRDEDGTLLVPLKRTILAFGPTVVGPRDVPGLRLWLLEQWRPGRPFHLTIAAAMVDRRSTVDPDALHVIDNLGGTRRADGAAKWESETLQHASLWWVSPAMGDLLTAASRSVPDDLRQADLPEFDHHGFVVLEEPLIMHGTHTGEIVSVDGFAFGPSSLPSIFPGRPEPMMSGSIPSVSLSFYSRHNEHGRYDGVWTPLGRSDWPKVDMLGEVALLIDGEASQESYREDRQLYAAFVTLLHQEGIAQTTVERPSRPVARRTERAGLPRELASVRVVRLRELRHGEHEHGGGERREWSHRWIVQGHWRNARVGVGRTQRRLVWVSPHIKGPSDKPLATPAVVKAWVR